MIISDQDIQNAQIDVKLTNSSKDPDMKAVVDIDLGDLKIAGYRIRRSQYDNGDNQGLWVTPPVFRTSTSASGYKPVNTFSKDCWKKIEQRIVEEYQKVSVA